MVFGKILHEIIKTPLIFAFPADLTAFFDCLTTSLLTLVSFPDFLFVSFAFFLTAFAGVYTVRDVDPATRLYWWQRKVYAPSCSFYFYISLHKVASDIKHKIKKRKEIK